MSEGMLPASIGLEAVFSLRRKIQYMSTEGGNTIKS